MRRYEPKQDGVGWIYRVRAYDPGCVFIRDLTPDGKDALSGEVWCNTSLVFAPGIDPSAVWRVDFDPIDYTAHIVRKVRVTYREFEDGEHLAPETEGFTTEAEFVEWYAQERKD